MRWRSGQVQASVSKHLKDGLSSLGWFDDPPRWTATNFVWDPDHDPEAVAAGNGPANPNTIGLSLGDVPDNSILDLGGGLQSVNIPVFIDIYAENRATARNLGDDIQQILQGELWTRTRYIPLFNHNVTPAVVDHTQALEARIVDARWTSGPGDWRRRWRVVSFTATVYFTGGGND